MAKPYRGHTPNSMLGIDRRALKEFMAQGGQFLLPIVALIEQAQTAVDDVIDVIGRAAIEAILELSAEEFAGPKQRGKRNDSRGVYWYGQQRGLVALKERQLKVSKPRLRKKHPKAGEQGEVAVPAYEAMAKDQKLADRMLEIVMRGVSTRRDAEVLPTMADEAGISKSQVSRETIDAGARVLEELAERDFSNRDILVIYLDGIQFGNYHVLCALGVDADGRKHVLGVRAGASETAEVAVGLLEDLVARGIHPGRPRLFVIDGAKALKNAIDRVFGKKNEIQRCRNHKLRNVLGHLPKDQHKQASATLRAAWKLEAKEGKKKIEKYASWVEQEHPSAARSLREGLDEVFTVNRLNLSPSLARCLTSTNVIDSSHSGIRQRTRRVTHWQSGGMALRWAASSFIETEEELSSDHGIP